MESNWLKTDKFNKLFMKTYSMICELNNSSLIFLFDIKRKTFRTIHDIKIKNLNSTD